MRDNDPRFSPSEDFVPMKEVTKGKKITREMKKQIDKDNSFILNQPPAQTAHATRTFNPRIIGDYISVLAILPMYPTTEIARMKAYAHNSDALSAIQEYMQLSGHYNPLNPHVGKPPSSRNVYAKEYVTGDADPGIIVAKLCKDMHITQKSGYRKLWANHVVFGVGLRGQGEQDLALMEDIQSAMEEQNSDNPIPINFYQITPSDEFSYEDLSLRKMQRHIKSWQLMATFLSLLNWPLTDSHLAPGGATHNNSLLEDLRELSCGTHLEERNEDNAQKAQAREKTRVAAQQARPQQAAGRRVRLRNPSA